MNKKTLPTIAITLVMLVWGLSFPSIKVAVTVLAPMTLALFRFIIAAAILIIILKTREPKLKIDRKDMLSLAISGLFAFTIYFAFENNGLKLTTASAASIIIATIPIFVIISDFLIFGNKITWPKGVAVALSFLGVYLIVSGSGQFTLASKYFVGNILMLGAALSSTIYSLMSRQLRKKYSALAITTYQTAFAALANIPFALMEHNKWQLVDGTIIANVIFLGVFCSAIGYYFYVLAIGRLGVDVTTLFSNIVPVVTVISSYFILGEKITTIQLIGGGIVITAVYLVDLSKWLPFGKALPEVEQNKNL